ncbi:uncharacterized protein [Bemisia tabaci]
MELRAFLLGLCALGASGRPQSGAQAEEPSGPGRPSDWKFLRQVYSECFVGSADALVCLKQRAVRALDQAAKLQSIPLIDGFSLTRTVNDSALLDEDPQLDGAGDALPRDMDQKDRALDNIILKKLERFFAARSITVDNSHNEVDGRKKKEKELHHYLMMAAATAAAILGPLAFKSLAIIATKALVVSKIAIVIASIVAIKKLFSHPHQESEVVSHHYGRSLRHAPNTDAARLAYNAHQPE